MKLKCDKVLNWNKKNILSLNGDRRRGKTRMKKLTGKLFKVLATMLMIVMLFSIAAPLASACHDPSHDEEVYSDSHGHWAYWYIGWAMQNGISTGFADGTFRPNVSVTRAEFVTFLHRVAGRPEANAEAEFPDMPRTAVFREAISWAVEAGVTTGFDDGTFRPNSRIHRQQIAAMLFRYADSLELSTVAPEGELDRFNDDYEVADWAEEEMRWAVYQGLITGQRGGFLAPRNNATRAETVTMLQRFVATFEIELP